MPNKMKCTCSDTCLEIDETLDTLRLSLIDEYAEREMSICCDIECLCKLFLRIDSHLQDYLDFHDENYISEKIKRYQNLIYDLQFNCSNSKFAKKMIKNKEMAIELLKGVDFENYIYKGNDVHEKVRAIKRILSFYEDINSKL